MLSDFRVRLCTTVLAVVMAASCQPPLNVATDVGPDATPGDAVRDQGEVFEPLELSAGNLATLRFEEDALSLLRGGQLLLTMDLSTFKIALVEDLDDDLNYDPTYLEPGQFGDYLYEPIESLRWVEPEKFTNASVEDSTLTFTVDYGNDGTTQVTATASADGRFKLHWFPNTLNGKPVMYRLEPQCDPSEGFYGLGETFDSVEHRGHVRSMHFVPAALESGYNEAHVPIPLALGTTGWGLFVESMRPGVFAFGTEVDDRFRATFGLGAAGKDGLIFHVFAEEHPLDLTRHYYEITGFPGLISRAALGPWIWRDEVEGQEAVEADLETIRELDLATTGYWIDRPYATDVNSFDLNTDGYTDPVAMMALAQDLGFEMALWHTPYLDPDGALSGELHLEAKMAGYFPPLMSPMLAKWGPPIDFSNPTAFGWWQQRLAGYQQLGITGYKLDYGEEIVVGGFGIRFPWLFDDGTDELTMHRRFQIMYHRAYRDMLPESGGFLLCRSGSYGDQVHGTIIWPGDIDASMSLHGEEVTKEDGTSYASVGGLPAAIIAGSSLGASGFPFFASDTGGYRNAPPTKEVFIRWFQHTAFSPVMQVGTNTNDLPWAFGKEAVLDEQILDLYREFARIHLRLFPYLWTYVKSLASDGRAIQRPLGLAHPELGVHPSFTYLLGDYLLVAPVITSQAQSRKVNLPPGEWVGFFDGARVQGDAEIATAVTIDNIPVFLRAGAPLPMLRPTIDSIRSGGVDAGIEALDDDADPLWVLVAPGEGHKFVLYDGTTLETSPSANGFGISRVPGSEYDGRLVIQLISVTTPPSEVFVQGEAISPVDVDALKSGNSFGWAWNDEKAGTLLVGCDSSCVDVVVTF